MGRRVAWLGLVLFVVLGGFALWGWLLDSEGVSKRESTVSELVDDRAGEPGPGMDTSRAHTVPGVGGPREAHGIDSDAPDPSSHESWALGGRLVAEETGEPIEGAWVSLGSERAESLADGRFRFEGRSGIGRTYELRVHHPHHEHSTRVRIEREKDLGDIRLPSLGRLIARVHSPLGERVPGASLHLVEARWEMDVARSLGEEVDRFYLDGTEVEDRIEVPRLPPGRYTLLAGALEWSQSQPREVEIQRGEDQEVHFDLEAPGQLKVRVVEGGDRPISAVQISVIGEPIDERDGEPVGHEYVLQRLVPGNADWSSGPSPTLVTNADGEALLLGMPSGRYAVGAERPGGRIEETIDVVSGARAELMLRAPMEHLLQGQVHSTSGDPIPDVHLQLGEVKSGRSSVIAETQSDQIGRFSFETFQDRRYVLEAEKQGYATSKLAVAEGVDEARIILPRGASIEGRVMSAEGGLIEATVSFTWATEEATRASDDGRFELKDVPPGQIQITASARMCDEESVTLELREGERRQGVDFYLREARPPAAPSFLEGRVLNVDGSLVDDAEVLTTRLGESPANSHPAPGGKFRVGPMDADEYLVWAESKDGRSESRQQRVELRSGETRSIVLGLESSVHVFGRVVDSSGEGLPGLKVSFSSEGWPESRVCTTGKSGEYSVTGVPAGAGRVEVSVVEDDWKTSIYLSRRVLVQDVRVPTGAEEWELPLVVDTEDQTRLLGRLLAEGDPVAGALVILRATDQNNWARSDEAGEFMLDPVAKGPGWLMITIGERGERRVLAQIPVTLSDRSEGRQDFHLPSTRVFGRISGTPKQFMGSLIARSEDRLDGAVWDLALEAEDVFEVYGVSPGSYVLFVRTEEGLAYRDRVDIGPGETDLGRIVPEPAGKVHLSVVKTRPGIGEVTYRLESSPYWTRFVARSVREESLFMDLPAGQYRFLVEAEGASPLSIDVQVEAGKETEKEIELR